ncbi:MAG: hypothetical protein ACR2JC_05450 [Chloroflexota bacterium]|nr:MAG: hypothetical protein DLM70_16880 [Chloroflexota bacterium]
MKNAYGHPVPDEAILDLPVVCTLTEAALMERKAGIDKLAAEALEAAELPDGYSLRFPGNAKSIARIVDIIVAERACCLFFTFGLTFMPNEGPVSLHVRGPEGAKEFVQRLLDGAQLASASPESSPR